MALTVNDVFDAPPSMRLSTSLAQDFSTASNSPALSCTDSDWSALESPPPLEIGQDEHAWLYHPDSNKFDVSRGAARKLALSCDEALFNHAGVLIDPNASALVIVDMQNYFINPEYHHHPAGLAAIPPLLRVIARCRKEGIPLIWLNWVTNEKELASVPASVLRAFSRARIPRHGHGWGVNLGSRLPNGERVLFEGTSNADIFAPLKAVSRPEDTYCRKSRMSGMWSPAEEMHAHLTATGRKTLLFAGINTDQCVLSTLTDAHSSGWDCVLLSDCSGTATSIPGAQAVSEGNVATNMGFVVGSEEFCGAEVLGEEAAASVGEKKWEEGRHDSGIDAGELEDAMRRLEARLEG